MHNILRNLIDEFGKDIFMSTEKADWLISIMADDGAFTTPETRVFKKILRDVVADGYSKKLLTIGKWNEEAQMLASDYARRRGYEKANILYLFKCISYGMKWTSTVPTQPDAQNKIDTITSTVTESNKYKQEKQPHQVADKKIQEVEKKLEEVSKRVLTAEKRAQEAQKREAIAKRNAVEHKKRADQEMAKRRELEQERKEEKEKEKARLQYEAWICKKNSKQNEKIEKITIGIAGVLVLCFAIASIFFWSRGFWQTLVSVVVAGGCAYLLAYGYVILEFIFDDFLEDSHLAIKILGALFFIALVCTVLGLGYEIVDWAD